MYYASSYLCVHTETRADVYASKSLNDCDFYWPSHPSQSSLARCSLWVHGSRTSALMSYDDPCNCGQHIPVCLRVARARSPSGLASGVQGVGIKPYSGSLNPKP